MNLKINLIESLGIWIDQLKEHLIEGYCKIKNNHPTHPYLIHGEDLAIENLGVR